MADTNTPHEGGAVEAPPAPKAAGKSRPAPSKQKPGLLPPYNVVLLDDNDHTYEYVIEMLQVLFAHPQERGFQLAKEVDKTGRAIVLTTHKEKAELKRDQIHAFGRDVRMSASKGSMSAIIEPAEA
jgi:ATP-dependent Clp protease adaptor protein ClpS